MMLLSLRFRSLLLALPLAALPAAAQISLPSSAHTTSGLELTVNGLTLRVDALRQDALRVRLWPNGHPAEDASWAVLPSSRIARVPVTAEPDGFHTDSLRVTVSPDLRLTIADLAGNVLQQDALPISWSSDGFKVTKRKTEDDHFFGLGDKPGPLDRAGETFTLWNTDAFGWQESTDPIYKSIPFFLEMHSGRTLGVLFDNTFRTFFDFGRERTDRYSFSAPAGPLDYYVLYGPEPKQVLADYAWLTGPAPLPPLWSMGFQQSRYSYYPQSQVEEIAAHLRKDHIPADALWLDIDFQDRNRPFTVDKQRFPDFPGLIHRLSGEHLHTIVITDLHIANAPNQGYAPFDSGKAGDHFVKIATSTGTEDYVGPVWPGPSVFPDFTRAQTREWWGTLYKEFVADGVSGFWNDMNEPAVFRYPSKTMPDEVQHRIDEPASLGEGFSQRTAFHPEIHNVFGLLNSRATHDGSLTLRPNERPYVMTRASYAGGQRYAVTWTGDNSSTWNHLRQTTPQLENLGLSGFAFAGADVGGFAGSPSPDLLTRWLMLAAFQPIDRDHAAKGTRPHEPWVDGPAHEDIRRRFIEERYRLMPYLYTTAEETSRTGLPIVRPLFVEFPHAAADNHPLDSDAAGEFLFGPSILVADTPSPEEVAPYEVHLPPGLWYDYWTGEKLDRRAPLASRDLEIRDAAPTLKPILITPKLDQLPLYVRAGAILPMQPLTQSTEETPQGPLTLRVYAPSADTPTACSGELYTDDGHTFDYQHGAYLRLHPTCTLAADGSLTITLPTHEGSYKPWWTQVRIEVVGLTARQANAAGRSYSIERTPLGAAITLPNTDQPQTITFR
ncbi:MAG TPA: TIM-barrel domain-containing protein [Granulicella sp.]